MMKKTYTFAVFGVCLMFGLSFGCRQKAETPAADKPKTAGEQELTKLKAAAKESIKNAPQPAGSAQRRAVRPKIIHPPAGPRHMQKPGVARKPQAAPGRPARPGAPRRPAPTPALVRPPLENVVLPDKPTAAELAKRKAAALADAMAKDMETRQRALDEAAKKKAAENKKKPAGGKQ